MEKTFNLDPISFMYCFIDVLHILKLSQYNISYTDNVNILNIQTANASLFAFVKEWIFSPNWYMN